VRGGEGGNDAARYRNSVVPRRGACMGRLLADRAADRARLRL